MKVKIAISDLPRGYDPRKTCKSFSKIHNAYFQTHDIKYNEKDLKQSYLLIAQARNLTTILRTVFIQRLFPSYNTATTLPKQGLLSIQ